MSIGKRIRERREALNLSREKLAEMLDISPSAISNYERDSSFPRDDILLKLFPILQCDANYLFQDEFSAAASPYCELNKLNSYGQKMLITYLNTLLADKKYIV